jgi:hypothetical protein
MKFFTFTLMLAISLHLLLAEESLIANERRLEPASAPTRQGPVRLHIKGHPRLLWSADDIPGLRVKAADRTETEQGTSTAELWQQVVEKAQGTKADILTMSLVCVVSGEQEWAGRIKDKMLQICAEEDWGADFKLANASLDVAVGLDAIYERLSENERTLICRALAEKGVQPLLKAVARRPWTNNVALLQCGALGLSALVLVDEPGYPLAGEWAAQSVKMLREMFEDDRHTDGGYYECTLGYGTVGMDYDGRGAILLPHALKRGAGDDSLLRHPYLRKLMYFAMYTMRPDGDGGVGFCDTWQGSGFHLTVLRVAGELNSGHGMWYIQKTQLLRNSNYPGPATLFLFYNPSVKVRSPQGEIPLSKHFRGIGWVTLRTGWDDPDGILFAMQTETGGHSHEHNSMNHYEIHGYRSRLATSPGYHHGRSWRATLGHNVLWLDGKGQSNPMLRGRFCSIKEFVGSDFFDYTMGEAHTYGTPDDPWLDFWNRHVVFAKPDYVVLYDQIRTSKGRARKVSWLLQVTTPHAIAQKGEYKVEDDTLISLPLAQGRHANHGNEGQLFGKVLLPQPFTTHVGTFSGKYFPNETYGPYYELSLPEKVIETAFLVVLYPQLRGAPAPQVEKTDAKNGVAFEVTVPDGRNFHLYRTSDSSSSGAGLESDGLISMASIDLGGKLIRYALCDGKQLKFGGRVLISSNAPVVGAAFASFVSYTRDKSRMPHKKIADNEFYGVIKITKAADISLVLPRQAVSLKINGKQTSDFSSTPAGLTQLNIQPGTHKLKFRLKRMRNGAEQNINSGRLSAGVGKVVITPPVGVYLGGYALRTKPSTGVDRDLYARALVLDDGRSRVGLVVADVISLGDATVTEVRRLAQAKASIAPKNLTVACTHSHSAPGTRYSSTYAIDADWSRLLPALMTEAVTEAVRNMTRCRVGSARATVGGVSFDRTARLGEGGPIDQEVVALVAETLNDEPLAMLINFACHPVVFGPRNLLISPDYPGYLVDFVERTWGGTAIFVNGCCGDIDPYCNGIKWGAGDSRECRRMAQAIGSAALQAASGAQLRSDFQVNGRSSIIDLPLRPVPSREKANAMLREAEKRLKSAGGSKASRWEAKYMLRWAQAQAKLAEEGMKPRVRMEIQALDLGPEMLVGIPGEVFSGIGLNIKRSLDGQQTMIAGYANGCLGYIPTRAAFRTQGYATRLATHLSNGTALAPSVGEVIAKQAVTLARSLQRPP